MADDIRALACEHCGESFNVSGTRRRVFCSTTCKNRAHSAKQRMQPYPDCDVEGCGRSSRAPKMRRPLCSMHYRRLRLTGDVGPAGKVRGDRFGVVPCSVEGCERKYYAKGMCGLHWQRTYKNGEAGPPMPTKRADGEGTYYTVKGYRRFAWYENGVRRSVSEHRLVMEEHLGRPLAPEVHHRDGDRARNDIANLELWYVSQPAGQRVSDLIAFIAEFHEDAMRAELKARRREQRSGQLRLIGGAS